jgi:predicted nucleotidyltransferase
MSGTLRDPGSDPVLIRFAALLRAEYGDRLDRAILFGSRARGDHRPDSDYDVAVFLHGMIEWWAEVRRLADLTQIVMEETGGVISAKPFSPEAYDERTFFIKNVRQDGIAL